MLLDLSAKSAWRLSLILAQHSTSRNWASKTSEYKCFGIIMLANRYETAGDMSCVGWRFIKNYFYKLYYIPVYSWRVSELIFEDSRQFDTTIWFDVNSWAAAVHIDAWPGRKDHSYDCRRIWINNIMFWTLFTLLCHFIMVVEISSGQTGKDDYFTKKCRDLSSHNSVD